VLALLGLGLAAWVIVGSFAEIVVRSGLPKVSFGVALSRVAGMPRSLWGTALGHLGLGLTLLGIVSVTAFQQEIIKEVKPGETIRMAGYEIVYEGFRPRQEANFVEDVLSFRVSGANVAEHVMTASKRVYTTRSMPTTEAGIETYWFSQLYVSPGEVKPDGTAAVRFWWKPLVTLIWGGTVAMVLGGAISLSDRRLRVGAPQPAKSRAGKAAAHA